MYWDGVCFVLVFSVNSVLLKYKYIKIQTNHIHVLNILHLKGIQK